MSTFAHAQIKPSVAPLLNPVSHPGVIDTVINPHWRSSHEKSRGTQPDPHEPNLDALIWFVRQLRQ